MAFIESSFFIIGLVVFLLLFVSAIQNYDKNRSYFVGGFFILSAYSVFAIATLLNQSLEFTNFPSITVDFEEFSLLFFSFFGVFISCALIFYFFMSCIRMLFERIR